MTFKGYKIEFMEDSEEWFVLNTSDNREQYNLPETNTLEDVKTFIKSLA